MKRSLLGMFILLALVLSACGSNSSNANNNNGVGVNATTQTGSNPVTMTDTTGMTAPTAVTDAAPTMGTDAAPTMGTVDTAATMGVAAPMLTPNPNATSMPGDTAMPTNVAGKSNIEDVLTTDPRFSTLAKAVDMAQLANTLRANGPITLFAPTNDAFAAMPTGELDKVLADPAALTKLLGYHVVSGTMRTSDIGSMTSLPTMNGQSIQITKNGTEVMLNGNTRLNMTDITTTNGVIHVLDTVLTPSN